MGSAEMQSGKEVTGDYQSSPDRGESSDAEHKSATEHEREKNEPPDHREVVDYVAQSSSKGTDKRLHKIHPDCGEVEHGDVVETPCSTPLVDEDSEWKAKSAACYPPGHRELCDHEECFGNLIR